VIEVVYQTSVVHLRDRLETAFRDGYGGMVAVLQNADVSAARVERHLSRVGTIEVARVDPHVGTCDRVGDPTGDSHARARRVGGRARVSRLARLNSHAPATWWQCGIVLLLFCF